MRRFALFAVIGFMSFALTGCVARTYPLTRERVDQDLSNSSGNKGYIMGQAPYSEPKARKTERTVQVFEIELGSPVKLHNKAKPVNSGAMMQQEPEAVSEPMPASESAETTMSSANLEKYTVVKNDTLQKISQKLYGTTKKWVKIYNLNKDVLKTPNSIYPGQVINVPAAEGLKETKENLK